MGEMNKYFLYQTAVNNGIKFGPNDVSMEDILIFDAIKRKFQELHGNKSG